MKDFSPKWSKFFPFKVVSFLEGDLDAKKQTGSHKICLPCTKCRKYTNISVSSHFKCPDRIVSSTVRPSVVYPCHTGRYKWPACITYFYCSCRQSSLQYTRNTIRWFSRIFHPCNYLNIFHHNGNQTMICHNPPQHMLHCLNSILLQDISNTCCYNTGRSSFSCSHPYSFHLSVCSYVSIVLDKAMSKWFHMFPFYIRINRNHYQGNNSSGHCLMALHN